MSTQWILSCTGNFNLLMLLSKMANSNIKAYKPVSGKLYDHFGFKADDNNKVIDGEKAHCFSVRKS